MALEKDELKIAIEDARARQAALVALIYFTDTQAMSFLRWYIAIGAGAVSAFAAAFGSEWTFRAEIIGSALGLLFSTFMGSFFCFKAMTTVNIHLPGRGPDFWLWGLSKEVEHDTVAEAYLEALEETMKSNRVVNESSAEGLKWAKIWGMLSPGVAIGGALVAAAIPWAITFSS